jgi:predicted Ser/Thr protein kinase
MLSVCKIHQAGIIHGDLLDGHHFVKMGDGVRVIDFSSAIRHYCRNGIPRLLGGSGNDVRGQCEELVNMEKTFGFRNDVTDAGRPFILRFWS